MRDLFVSVGAECKKIAWLATAVLFAIGYTQVEVWGIVAAIVWFLLWQALAHFFIWYAGPG